MSQIANLIVKVDADGKGLSAGIKQASRDLQGLYSGLTGGAVALYVKSLIDYGGELSDIHYKTGLSVQTQQQWDEALRQSGSSLEDAMGPYKHLQKAMFEAMEGNDEVIAAFKRFGISLDDVRKKNAPDLFMTIARSIEKLPNTAVVTSDALKIMGKSGDSMLSAMRQGFAEAAEAASVVSPAFIAQADAIGDSWVRVWRMIKKVSSDVLLGMYDGVNYFKDSIEKIIAMPAAFLGAWSVGGHSMASLSAALDAAAKAATDVDANRAEEMRKRYEEAGRLIQNLAGHPDNADKLTKPQKELKEARNSFQAAKPASDALARIGLFRGGAQEQIPLLRQQVSQLQEAVSQLRGIKASLSDDGVVPPMSVGIGSGVGSDTSAISTIGSW